MDNQSSAAQKAARAVAAAVNIARGAAYGGIYGAVFEAVKSFLPELVRAVVIFLFAAILIPMLVFTALPNVMFGYDSAGSPDIVALTASARALDEAYRSVSGQTQPLVDRLVDSILPDFRTDGGADYDSYTVYQSLGGLNAYWLIAIGSVRYRQDLSAMDKTAVEALRYAALDYSATVTDRVLHISVWELTPEAYMDRLGFSREEKDWAALLYATLTEDQSITPEDSGGMDASGTNYGELVFSNTDTPVVYYNQTDARWGGRMYGRSGTIAEAGCGPTALAIVVSSLTSRRVTPVDAAQWSVENGYRCEGNGSYHSLIPNGGRHYGLTVTGIGSDGKRLAEALQEGKLVVALMSRGYFTRGGHFIVLRGVTADGKILVADPASVRRSNQTWALSLIVNEASRKAGSGGPFWVFSP